MKKALFLAVATLMVCGAPIAAKVPLMTARQNAERFAKMPVAWPKPTKKTVVEGCQLVPSRHAVNSQRKAPFYNAPENALGVFGYITNSDYWDFVPQWVELTSAGYESIWDDTDYWMKGEVKLDAGWVRDGKLCGYATQLLFGQYLEGYFYKEFDLDNGTATVTTEIDYDTSNTMYVAAYSPERDLIFGFGTDPDSNPCLLSAPGNNPTQISVVRYIDASNRGEMIISITWNDAEKRFVGVNYNNQMVAVSTDGTFETILDDTGVSGMTRYYTGLCYDATNRVYYWNVFDDYFGYIYRIDIASGKSQLVSTLDNCEVFAMLYSPSKVVATDAPGRPAVGDVKFEGASTSGTVSFTMPTAYSDGKPLSGTLQWSATLDGAAYKNGSASAGQEVVVQYTGLTTGSHTFGCFATLDGAEGAEAEAERYVGNDTPSAPANVRLSLSNVSWDAVTTGVHGGYVDASAITYTVYLDGEQATTTTKTSAEITINGESSIQAHQASVTASFDGRVSEAGVSNKFVYGAALNLPVYFKPTASEFLLMTTNDGDGDGYGWHFVDDALDADYPCLDSDYSHNEQANADDWIFFPAINFDESAYYTLTLEAKGRLTQLSPDEFFEVKIGKEAKPSAMDQTIIAETRGQVGFIDYERYFKISNPGEYYIGIHATSEPMMFGVRVRDIRIVKSDIVANSPVSPTQISVVPAEKGELSATISFTLPTSNVDGKSLPSTTLLTAKVEGESVLTLEGKPGESVSGKIATKQGTNRLKVVVYNGESPGLPSEASVYTGIDVPNAPASVVGVVSEDNINVTLDWTAPDGGEHNGYINPEEVSYAIHTYNGMMGWMPIDNVGQGVTHYEFFGDADEGLAYIRLGVSAETIAGSSKYLTAVGAVVGTPYEAPVNEDFDSPYGALIGPWASVGSTNCQWGFADLKDISYDWTTLEGGAMVGIPGKAGIQAGIAFPKFSTLNNKGNHIGLRVWDGGGAPSRLTLKGVTYGLEDGIEILSKGRTGDWLEMECYLPEELRNRPWVQLQLIADFTSLDQLCVIDDFIVDSSMSVSNAVAENYRVSGGIGEINFENCEGRNLYVSTIDGRCLAALVAPGSLRSVKVPQGVYIVKVDNRSYKLMVK